MHRKYVAGVCFFNFILIADWIGFAQSETFLVVHHSGFGPIFGKYFDDGIFFAPRIDPIIGDLFYPARRRIKIVGQIAQDIVLLGTLCAYFGVGGWMAGVFL
ncbi:MAG TPA: hypothetical protein VFF78_08700 [Anaerolineaceae bacterium]|nr:hypothetical protein [Anaerolineaceae bacterium]